MRPVILVFAKAPVAGHVKTRLHTVLTPLQAARLHKAFVLDTLESLNYFAATASIELFSDRPYPAWPCPYRLQTPGHLGDKMYHALSQALAAGHERALILGTDAPTLPVSHLEHLLHADADVAFGPAEDGGYYAIAARRVTPAMFDGVAWSTDQTLAQSQHSCAAAGLTTALGPPWWDVDEPADLARLRRLPSLPRHTRLALTAP